MTEAEKMLLDDAIQTSIEAEKKNIKTEKDLRSSYILLLASMIMNLVFISMLIGG